MYFSRLILFSLIHEVFPFSSPALMLQRNCHSRSIGFFSSLETTAGVIGDDTSLQVDVHIDDLFRSEKLTELDTNTSDKIMKATHRILSTKKTSPNHSLIEDAEYVIESGWAKVESESGFEVIEQIILHLEQLEVELPISLYTMASDSARSPERAESMIRRAEKKYNAILDAIARESRNRSSLEKAEKLLDTMIEKNIANIISFNTLMNAYAKLGDESAVEDLFRKVESMDVDFQPDVFTYTTLIDAITRSSDFNRAERAETILAKMEKMASQGNKGVEPTTITYNAILHAWSSSGKRDAAKRAEQLLTRMEEIYKSGENEKAEPNVISYTSVIDSYARSGSSIDAERIFKRMEDMFEGGNLAAKPNAQSFNAVINSWVQNKSHPGAALRAESILVRMMQLSKKGNENVRPNVITFSTVINGWSKCASEEEGAAAKAERVFKTMLREYKEGNESAKPNIISYCSLIDAYVKSNDSGSLERAEAIYNSISTAYMKGTNDIKPSKVFANQIISGWSTSGRDDAGEKAERILDHLNELSNIHGVSDVEADARTYTSTISAYAKSKKYQKANKCKELLDEMVTSYENGNRNAKPNVFAYTAVINACAHTSGGSKERKEALGIATSTYKELCSSEYDSPNHITYAMFLRSIINLIPEESLARKTTATSVFKKCRESGQVTLLIMQLLEKAFDVEQVEEITGRKRNRDGQVVIEDLPEKWKFIDESLSRKGKRRRRTFGN